MIASSWLRPRALRSTATALVWPIETEDPGASFPGNAEADGTAQYVLYNSTDTTYDSRLTTITIDQATHHGQWVRAGSYTFAHPVVDLEITDRGAGHAAIALSAVKLTCT